MLKKGLTLKIMKLMMKDQLVGIIMNEFFHVRPKRLLKDGDKEKKIVSELRK